MGEFDKNQPAATPADARRKQILAGVLGAVLLAVLGFSFLKGNPESATASPSPGNASETAPLPPTRSASDELLDLSNDPTAHLLQAASSFDPESASVPRDPFQLSKRFGQVPKTVAVKSVEPVDVYSPSSQPAQVMEIPADAIKIEGIIRVGSKLQAIVNGSIVSRGMNVGDAHIVDIQSDCVVVRHKNWPHGPTTTITLEPKAR